MSIAKWFHISKGNSGYMDTWTVDIATCILFQISKGNSGYMETWTEDIATCILFHIVMGNSGHMNLYGLGTLQHVSM